MKVRFEPHPFRQYAKSGKFKGHPMAQVMEDSSSAPVTVVIYVNGGRVRLDVLDRTLSTYEKEEDLILEEHVFGPPDSLDSFHEAFRMFKAIRKRYRADGGVTMFNVTGVKIGYLRAAYHEWAPVENADVVRPRI